MDPAATLAQVEQDLQAGRLEDARGALRDYWTWRRRGGFEPPGGDALARRLDRQLRRASRREPRAGGQGGEDADADADGGPTLIADAIREWATADGHEWAAGLRRPDTPTGGPT